MIWYMSWMTCFWWNQLSCAKEVHAYTQGINEYDNDFFFNLLHKLSWIICSKRSHMFYLLRQLNLVRSQLEYIACHTYPIECILNIVKINAKKCSKICQARLLKLQHCYKNDTQTWMDKLSRQKKRLCIWFLFHDQSCEIRTSRKQEHKFHIMNKNTNKYKYSLFPKNNISVELSAKSIS